MAAELPSTAAERIATATTASKHQAHLVREHEKCHRCVQQAVQEAPSRRRPHLLHASGQRRGERDKSAQAHKRLLR